jgi:hypothetical protein
MTTLKPQHLILGVIAALGIVCASGLWHAAAVLPVHMPLDPNEGWNAYHTAAMMSGGALYPGPDAYLVNNYPPLSYYVVGAAGLLAGDFIVAGRIVSLTAFAAIAAMLTLIARAMGASRLISFLPAAWFGAMLLLSSDYVGMDDPQMLAHAVSLAGLLVLVRKPDWRFAAPAAAALFVAAFFVKHNVVALPLAATLWLYWQKRRPVADNFVFYGALFGLIGLMLFRFVFGLSLFDAVASARQYSTDALVDAFQGWLYWTGLPAIALLVLFLRMPRDPAVRFTVLYAVIAAAIGTYFLGGAGVDPNVLFEADIALALGTALAVQRLAGWKALALATAAAVPLLWSATTNTEWQRANLSAAIRHEEIATTHADIAFMAGRKGPAMCEMLAFCYWAGKPPAVDMFNIGQAFETGARSDAEIAAKVERKYYAVIQFDPGEPYALGENVYQALTKSYRLHHNDDFGIFYVPK